MAFAPGGVVDARGGRGAHQPSRLARRRACAARAAGGGRGRRPDLAAAGRADPTLVLYGFVARTDGGYSWTIPLLEEALRSAEDREYQVARLVKELPPEVVTWTVKSDRHGLRQRRKR